MFCINCRSEIDPKYKACPFCGEAVSDFLRRYADAPIDGKYQILGRLGVGGMGEVYKALHIHLNALRVIKLMRSAIATDPGAHERFLREARMATRIHHPHVAALFDFSTLDDGSRYMVWEYIEGTNLHELINQRGPLSPRYAAQLAVQALTGLDAIHRAGIVHRDISPENLMVTRDDEGNESVKIIDLGIAKQWGDQTDTKTKTGMFVGKWKYCSPEHLGMVPEGERIDGRADIYSFGIVFYEMLTGVPAFQAETPHQYLMMHANARPKALREMNPTVTASPELEALIFRSLEKDRNKRFASAREFARAVEDLIPSLDDTPGASPILPTAIEVTEDPTRSLGDEPTVASLSRAATLRTTEQPRTVQNAGSKTLDRSGHAMSTAPGTKRRTPIGVIAVIAVVVIGLIGGIAYFRQQPNVGRASARLPVVKPIAAPPSRAEARPTLARIGINAFPWGEVTSIRNAASGETIALKEPIITPAPIELAPGRYEITLTNPAFNAPVTKTVEVRGGEERLVTVQFADPSSAKLPSFAGATQ